MTDGSASTSDQTAPTCWPMFDTFLSLTEAWMTSWLSTFWSTSLRISLQLSLRNGIVSWSLEDDSP